MYRDSLKEFIFIVYISYSVYSECEQMYVVCILIQYILIDFLPTRRTYGPGPNIRASYAAYQRSTYVYISISVYKYM